MKSEPVLILAAIAAVISVAVGFGLSWTPAQVSLVNVAVAAVASVIVRGSVSPTP